jgi:hypothetical protein
VCFVAARKRIDLATKDTKFLGTSAALLHFGTLLTKSFLTDITFFNHFTFAILLITSVALSRNYAFFTDEISHAVQVVERDTFVAHGIKTQGTNRDVAATFTKIIATSLAIRHEAILSIVDTLLA